MHSLGAKIHFVTKSALFTEDVKVFGEVIYTVEEVHRLDTAGQLALAFLQLVQGINLKFLCLPFATPSNRDMDCLNIATTTFDQWQKALLRCSSISALSLFYATLELGILWNRSRLQVFFLAVSVKTLFYETFSKKFSIFHNCDIFKFVVFRRDAEYVGRKEGLRIFVCVHDAIDAIIQTV